MKTDLGIWLAASFLLAAAGFGADSKVPADRKSPIVFTQVPLKEGRSGSRLVRLNPGGSPKVLTRSLYSASDPEISFDGRRILFSGKKTAADTWQVYEMNADGSGLRQITHEAMDCRAPIYLSALYILSSEQPTYRICFAGTPAGQSSSLYTVLLDGTATHRITFGLQTVTAPLLMEDGRILYTASDERRNSLLYAVNPDGADYSLFAKTEESALRGTPTLTADRRVIFVEHSSTDAPGRLAAVTLRRPMHSYHLIAGAESYQSPAALPDGGLLVSKLLRGSFGLVQFDLSSSQEKPLYDSSRWHDLQAKPLSARPAPDSRSSVVNATDDTGILYCLNVRTTGMDGPGAAAAKRLRVYGADNQPLGELDIEDDGSFQVRVPANTPLKLELLDQAGAVLRTSGWMWVRNHEPRGCIGCHEDPELAPENRFVKALSKPAVRLSDSDRQAIMKYANKGVQQ